MSHIIRQIVGFSFIFLVGLSFACGNSVVDPVVHDVIEKPIIHPKLTRDRRKIIAFGNSLTVGFGLPKKEAYPYLLQKKLNAKGYDYEVIDAGISGDTTTGGVERADWVFGQENGAIVILELGANDLLRGAPVKDVKENLEKIIQKATARGLRVLLCGMLAPETYGREYQRDFVSAFPDLAAKYKTDFVPFLLEGIALDPKLNQPDGIHPNAKGTILMLENIYKRLEPMLEKS